MQHPGGDPLAPRTLWGRIQRTGLTTFQQRQRLDVDEQAGPAYFQGLGLSRWLFWQRLKWAGRQIQGMSGQCAVDFGCGFGLMLPLLRSRYQRVVAIDQVPELAKDFLRRWDQQPIERAVHVDQALDQALTGGVQAVDVFDSLDRASIAPHSVDLVLALDVLEHFQELPAIVGQLHRLLKPDGHMLVSGPTENWLYRLGRRVVGFSGDYHHQTIHQVETALDDYFVVETCGYLPPLVPLFHLLRLRKRPERRDAATNST